MLNANQIVGGISANLGKRKTSTVDVESYDVVRTAGSFLYQNLSLFKGEAKYIISRFSLNITIFFVLKSSICTKTFDFARFSLSKSRIVVKLKY